jgi:serine/threonine protein kinase
MELIEGLSLLSFIKSKPQRKVEEADCKYIFSQIMSGINYLHLKGICHRDIKLENIIIDNNLSIKIIDFGFGAIGPKSKLQNFFCGTPSYMPPEIVQKKDYVGSFADIWSIGILLFTLLSGSFPFRGKFIFYFRHLGKRTILENNKRKLYNS